MRVYEAMKIDKTSVFLILLIALAATLKFIGIPLGPWWLGFAGTGVVLVVLLLWKLE